MLKVAENSKEKFNGAQAENAIHTVLLCLTPCLTLSLVSPEMSENVKFGTIDLKHAKRRGPSKCTVCTHSKMLKVFKTF